MKENETHIEALFQDAEDFGKTSFELIKLNAIDKSSDMISSAVAAMAIAMVVSLFTLFINIGVAFLIGSLLGNTYFGFFIVAGGYGLVALILYFFRDNLLKEPIQKMIIKMMRKQKQSSNQ